MPDATQDQDASPVAGARPWEVAWQDSLYGPGGFYRHHAPAEHFVTSAQGLPGAGRILAEAVLALARTYGCRRVVDLGAGRGELLAQLRSLAPDLHLTGVDVVPAPAALEVDRWLVSPGGATLPDALEDLHDTLVLAHEWLDVVPCHVVEREEGTAAGWRSVLVTVDGDEHPGPAPVGPDLGWARRWLSPEVRRAEIGRSRDRAFADLLSRVRSGLVVVVDYGHTAEDRPRHGTLTGFRDGREVAPVPDGGCDLTAHVAFDSLAQEAGACRLTRQGAVLRELVGDPTDPVPHHLASTDPQGYLAAVARRAALTALTTRGGLGDFRWLLAPRRRSPA
ncbi:SAM-dependent methyltransferase [Ornithinimicrobium sufpigmenti]|uniref:SAM-dependent methyltransferase n=1 Tax=Ornithinimicrobium sufpigmenti TaxID=2508882 RepID=UPI001EDE684E|nr:MULTISPECIES: SAM-dependent methyltransferase [unclassified Ornithinimicrobium]